MTTATATQRAGATWQSLPPELHHMIITEVLRSMMPAKDTECNQLKDVLDLPDVSFEFSKLLVYPLNDMKRDITGAMRELEAGKDLLRQVAKRHLNKHFPHLLDPTLQEVEEIVPLVDAFGDMDKMGPPLKLARFLIQAAIEKSNERFERRDAVMEEARVAELAAKKKVDDEQVAAEWTAFEMTQEKPEEQRPVEVPEVADGVPEAVGPVEVVKAQGFLCDEQDFQLGEESTGFDDPEEVEEEDMLDEDATIPEEEEDPAEETDGHEEKSDDEDDSAEEMDGHEGTAVEEEDAEEDSDGLRDMEVDQEDAGRIANGGVLFGDFARALQTR